MVYSIQAPSHFNTTIDLPASKSISNRALIINALAGGMARLDNLSDCDDTSVMLHALRDLPEVIDVKAAGTAMRFLTAYLSITEGTHVVTGSERMKHRPIGVLVEALRYLGAEVDYLGEEGYPPLRITGRSLEGGRIDMPGNVSSQYVSALMMAAPAMRKGLELRLTGEIASRPYIDLTLWVMGEFGADAEWSDIDTITVKPKAYARQEYQIENDWSGSSYWYELLALCHDDESKICLTGLMDGSRQGDSVVRYVFSLLGVKTSFQGHGQDIPTTVGLSRHLRTIPRLDYDFVNSPDLAQTLAAGCCGMNIPFHFKGLGSLRIKETDRIEALKTELRKLGYVLESRNDAELIWNGERCEASMAPIDTYEDHRMAMAFAPLAMVFPGLRIKDPQVVSKSYPHFWADLRHAGFIITEEE
ncbi:MAG: 3-phosphoshikimate 1-carboxyvinyltransferase [Prevotella sp.]